ALAGAGRMPYGTFTLYNALGGVVWAGVFGLVGYLFGQSLPQVEPYAAQASLAAVLLVLPIVLLILGRPGFWPRRDQFAEKIGSAWQRAARAPRFAPFRQRHSKAWRFVAARFESGEYLGLHLTVGFFVSVVALWLFGSITEDVIHHDPLTVFDVGLVS